MRTDFRFTGIEENYNHLFELSKKELEKQNAVKMIVDKKPGYPCRVSLKEAEIGEEVILFPYHHHKTTSPYQSIGPVFVRKNAKKAILDINEIPEILLHRLLSLRIYNTQGMMIDAKTIKGEKLKTEIEESFSNEQANYIHVHNSGPGCYNCQINRIQ